MPYFETKYLEVKQDHVYKSAAHITSNGNNFCHMARIPSDSSNCNNSSLHTVHNQTMENIPRMESNRENNRSGKDNHTHIHNKDPNTDSSNFERSMVLQNCNSGS